jgi:dihydrofolate reductase
MSKMFLFMMVSVDGYFEGVDHDLSWHNVDAEFNEYAMQQTKSVGTLLFGHRTYDLMASYWPTEATRKDDPIIAELMNNTPKIVFSKTMTKLPEIPEWHNAKVMNEITVEAIQNLKKNSQKDLAIYGSNNLSVSMLHLGLLDELRIMVNPVALGKGTALFASLTSKQTLKLTNTKTFNSGNVLLYYNIEK